MYDVHTGKSQVNLETPFFYLSFMFVLKAIECITE